jgi:nucleoside-diphosphate-sugar epimerase
MPTGPMNRVADNRRANQPLGWQPEVRFVDGLHPTIDWYFETKSPAELAARFETAALGR